MPTNDHVHPVVRTIAARSGVDEVRATDRDGQVQHTLVWYRDADEHDEVEIPKYALVGRDYVKMGDPRVRIDRGDVKITVPVFVDKGVYPKRYRKIHGIADDGKKYGWLWQTADRRQQTA